MPKKVSIINVATLEGHRDSIYALCGDQNGFLYSASGDGLVVQWDLSKPKDGISIAKVESSVYALAYDNRGFLVIGNNHQGINVIETASRKVLFSLALEGCGAVFDLLIDENCIYAACQNGVLYRVEIDSKKVDRYFVSDKSLRCLAFYKNGIVVGDSNGTLNILDSEFKVIAKYVDAEKSVFGVITQGEDLVSVSRDCHLRYYKQNKLNLDLVAHMYAINHIVKKADEKYFATASQDKTIKIWDAQNLQLLKVIDQSRFNGHSNSVNKLFWSRYGNLLVSCSDDRSIKIWHLEIAEN